MVDVGVFLSFVRQIAAERPTYRLGGSGEGYNAKTGARGTCDCIGLIIGALKRAGERWSGIHGSNYAARFEIMGGLQVVSTGNASRVLEAGMAVFKFREPYEDGYSLPDRYKQGGSMATGDLRDYYHVGVVLRVTPLQIVHCTSGGGADGIVIDTKLGRWTRAAQLKCVDYGVASQDFFGMKGEDSMALGGQTCAVIGGTLNLRKAKSVSAVRVARISEGERVYVYEDDGTWAKIRYDGDKTYIGYCKSEYLEATDEAAPDEAAEIAGVGTGDSSGQKYGVYIPCNSLEAANALRTILTKGIVKAG